MQLDERKMKILQAIVKNYLETGEPVGSRTISKYTDLMFKHADELEIADKEAASLTGLEQAKHFREKVLPLMEALRADVDSAEVLTAEDYWPVSTYGELLFQV